MPRAVPSARTYDAAMTSSAPLVRRAGLADLETLAALFDAYRRFYEQPPDIGRARAFLRARLERGESVVFLAEAPAVPQRSPSRISTSSAGGVAPGRGLGFCQLYPTWCSVAAARIFVLYDLFVDPAVRRGGVGRALMRAAQEFGRAAGAVRLDLSTAHSNGRAQALYESEGWRRDEVFRTYSLSLAGH